MSDVEIVQATWRDARALAQLDRRSFTRADAFGWFTFLGLCLWPSVVALKAVADGQIVGFVAGDRRRRRGHVAIVTLSVDPARRRRGIAGRLMRACEARFDQPIFRLQVRQGNAPAIQLYKKLGYSIIGTLRGYYADEDGYLMEKQMGRGGTERRSMSAERFRVIARVIILTPDRRVVMVTSQTGQALVLPGGAVDRGETLPQAAIREAQEECGVAAMIERAIWLREFYDRQHDRVNLEVYFLARPASGVSLADRWERADVGHPDLVRRVGLYSRDELKSIETPVYPVEMRAAFWIGLASGFADAYLGRIASVGV